MTTPADPRAVIAVTLKGNLSGNREIVDTTREIADSLAHWLTMKAEEFPHDDPRRLGYKEFAARLTLR